MNLKSSPSIKINIIFPDSLISANEPAKECSVTDCVDTHRERSIDGGNDNDETGSGTKCLNLNEHSPGEQGSQTCGPRAVCDPHDVPVLPA